MFWESLLGIWMVVVFGLATFWVKGGFESVGVYDAKIVFVHVPLIWTSYLAFVVAAVYGLLYLLRRRPIDDIKSAASAELGLLLAILGTLTGAVFAKERWGEYWSWDPRQTTVFIVLMTYLAYFALRASLEDESQKATLSSVYAILACIAAFFLYFILSYMMPSLHGHLRNIVARREGMSTDYRLVLLMSWLGFIGLYVWLFRLRVAVEAIRYQMTDARYQMMSTAEQPTIKNPASDI